MKYKALLFSIVFVALAGLSHAQQVPQYTQYFLNDFSINPGVTGTKDSWFAQTNGRYQWAGIRDAPRTFILNANGPLEGLNMGVGGYLFSDIVGPTRRTGFAGSYSYHLRITDELKLGMGLNFGATNWQIDGTAITLQNEADLALANSMQGVWVPDAGVGFHLYHDDFWVGLSAPQIIGNKLQFTDYSAETMSRLERHYFLTAGYNFSVVDDIVVQPSVFVRYIEPLPVQYDVVVRALYKDMLWVGGGYRVDAAVILMLGAQINDSFIFGYSFDLPTGQLSPHTTGSHEIMLGFKIQKRTSDSFRIKDEE